MKLILNADDFGLSESVNNGIVECFQAGTVKSTTVMMNQHGIDHAIQLYKQGLVPDIGLHFTVTAGKPLSNPEDVPSLIDEDGYFLNRQTLMTKQVCEDEVYLELNTQYQAALNAGFNINHIDSHHFAGVYPPLKSAFIRFANDINLPVRRVDNIVAGQDTLTVPTPDAFDMRFFDSGATFENLKAILLEYKLTHPNGIVELMCHPSNEEHNDLIELSSYNEMRSLERKILTSPELSHWLEEQDIECVGFNYLN
ncbi:ChbG/HpnK family deacetylase [Aliivibrio fischeri]|uniref:ChbG/HpnK family deacetylase n=1 Tax=Aliivibrio fischeri TaxID=668 RepID=A0A6N3Z1L6_ALIFS|nr:carbohydrate deacetylase [Aliivibrio fischeri]MUJ19457.1 ChbG/HpnK family deacetylase [Aliivibrio fischeri]MUK44270.1 ChbG/HpnK family deacetylase [Aliivibrio fischeri]MUK80147.1 ChbG/HpnK family deacetylase [Aliivibrio fischeri]MUK85341.1 ChbG/HpnK family deacetylase [Aliivibrio fischeri]